MLKTPIIENYIEIDGEEIFLNRLSAERKKEIGERIEAKLMKAAGFMRIPKSKEP